MASLTWKHQTLIQALISRGPLKEKEFQSIFTAVTGKNPEVSKKIFDKFLLEINKELSFIHFELRACKDQYDGQTCYGVINNISDEQSKLGTKYSVPQIAFFKGIIEAIAQIETASGSISSFDALNIRPENQVTEAGSSHQEIPAALRNFTMSQKEKTLDELVRDKWLCLTPDNNYGLGIRSLLDLRSWFRNNNVPSCLVCNEAGIKAEFCPNEDCRARVHAYCLKNMLSQGRDKVCPGCNKAWAVNIITVEEVVSKTEDEDEDGGEHIHSQDQASGPEAKKRKLRSNTSSQASLSNSNPKPTSKTRRVTRSSGKASTHLR